MAGSAGIGPFTAVLFDLDGTLMDADRAGRIALRRAIDAIPGAAEAFASFEFNGRTDRWILRGADPTRVRKGLCIVGATGGLFSIAACAGQQT